MSGITLDEIDGLFAEDTAHTAGDFGMQILGVRRDADTSLVDTDGDYAPLQVDALGALKISGTFASASNHVEDTAHTTGDTGSFSLAVRQDTKASTAGTDGDYAALIQNATGELYTVDEAGNVLLGTIDADTAILALSTQLEDAASAGGERLTMVGGYRQDADTSPVSADGDFHGFIFNSTGELKVSSKLDNTSNTSMTVTTTTVPITAGGIQLSSPVSGRREVTLQNLGGQDVWIQDGTGVTAGPAGNGFLLPKNSSATYEWGDNIDPFAITAASTSVVKVIETV